MMVVVVVVVVVVAVVVVVVVKAVVVMVVVVSLSMELSQDTLRVNDWAYKEEMKDKKKSKEIN